MMSVSPQTIAVDADRSAEASRPGGLVIVSYKSIGVVAGAVEASIVTVVSILGQSAYEGMVSGVSDSRGAALGVGLVASLIYTLTGWSAGTYSLPSLLHPAQFMRRAFMVAAMVLLSLTSMLFLFGVGSDLSRGSLLGFVAIGLGLCVVARMGAAGLIEELIEREAVAGRSAFLIGEEDELAALTAPYLLRHFGVREAGRTAIASGVVAGTAEFSRSLDEAMEVARQRKAREFIVATKWDRAANLKGIEQALRASPLPVRLIPHAEFRSIIGRNAPVVATSSYTVDLQRAPMGLTARTAKRAMDIVVASLAIVALMPVFVIAACAVKMDSAGPIIFRQRRNGFDRRLFVIFKFRTMKVMEDGAVVRQARRDDDRITGVGRFLRRTSIDELPQLFNVLRGEMSLIGPRPHALAHDQQYTTQIDDYCMRHHVKPGITGWAQIKGCRGETARPEDMQRRVELDLWYIRHWSLRMDLLILFRTALDVVVKRDAY